MWPATTVKRAVAQGAATVMGQSVVHHFHRLNYLVSSLRLLGVEHFVHARADTTCNAIPVVQGCLLILRTLIALTILVSHHVLQEWIVAHHCTLMACRTRHTEAVSSAAPVVLQEVVNLILQESAAGCCRRPTTAPATFVE